MSVMAAAIGFAIPGYSQLILDETWADGSRAEQNLPTESQWFAANRASNFVTTAGSMTFYTDPTGSRAGLTYFSASGSPVSLLDGQSLVTTLVFTPTGIGISNNSGNMRFGLVDYTGGTRLTGDGTSSGMNGAGVTGYSLFLVVTPDFGGSPMSILERTTPSNADLLGSGAAWTSLGSGGGVVAGDPGFVSGTEYTLQFTVTRNGAAADITTVIYGSGMALTNTVSDPSGSFTFDAFAIRNSRGDQTAEAFQFTQFMVDIVPEPSTAALAGLGILALAFRYRRR